MLTLTWHTKKNPFYPWLHLKKKKKKLSSLLPSPTSLSVDRKKKPLLPDLS
jgi:hypothetical protein